MSRRHEVAQVLRKSIERGDFTIGGFPPERRLAEIMGISRMTARLVIQELLEDRLLRKQENGRVEIASDHVSRRARQIAFLAPASNSPFVRNLQVRAERLAPTLGLHVQAVDYTDWEDPVFNDALASFDGVLISGCGCYPSGRVTRKIRNSGKPVVAIEADLSASGIPSIMLYPDRCVWQLLDYLYALGHRRIDCFNVLPFSYEVEERIAAWQSWLKPHHAEGTLINEPGGNAPDTLQDAYELMRRYMCGAHAPAMFFTGCICAIGALRAVQEAGAHPGVDFSACVLGGDGPLHRYLTPALTALEAPDPQPFLEQAFRWFRDGGNWPGDLLLAPASHNIFPGETVARLNN